MWPVWHDAAKWFDRFSRVPRLLSERWGVRV